MITFEVLGVPKTKGSLRPGVSSKGKAFVREQMGDALTTWREQLSATIAPIAAQLEGPMSGPVAVTILFRMPAPKKPKSWVPVAKGRNDLDKLCRTIFDHLSGTLLEDDAQVAYCVTAKIYGIPGAFVTIRSLEELHGLTGPVGVAALARDGDEILEQVAASGGRA